MTSAEYRLKDIKIWCEVIIENDKTSPPINSELMREWKQGRYSLAKDFLEIINRKEKTK